MILKPTRTLMMAIWLLVALLTAVPSGAVDTSLDAVLVAGDGTAGSTSIQFDRPSAIDVTPDGTMYVADSDNHRVQKISPDGTVTTFLGGNGEGDALDQLNYPAAVTVVADGTMYVSDGSNHRVLKRTPDGTVTVIAGGNGQGDANNQFWSPGGLAVDADGVVYVVDINNHRVQRIATDGAITTVAGGNGPGTGPGQLDFPFDVHLAADGALFVTGSFDGLVQRIATDGTVTTVAGGNGQGDGADQLFIPWSIDIDVDGTIYVADSGNARIQRVATDGTVTTVAGGNGPGSAFDQLNNPGSVVLRGGALFIVDNNNHRVLRLGEFTAAADTEDSETPTEEANPRVLTGQWDGVSGVDGSTARLYVAVFGRQPDASGFDYWVARIGSGLSLRAMSNYFINSPEFVATYSNLADAEFTDLLYTNVMGRQGDADGVRFWNEQLADGMDRSAMVLFFSDSPEFKNLTGSL